MHDVVKKYEETVKISDEKLEGDLVIPQNARGIIVFAHGSGSSRHSTRNQTVAQILNYAGFATLLVDLLSAQEKEIDDKTRHLRFDIDLLSARLIVITKWLLDKSETMNLKIGFFGSSTGAAAALVASTKLDNEVKTIVCRAGRLDLVDEMILQKVKTPSLLIIGGDDSPIIRINRNALKQLSETDIKELVIIPGANHLFEEQGKIEELAMVAVEWFECYLLGNGKNFLNRYGNNTPKIASYFREISFGIRFKDRAAAADILASMLDRHRHGVNNIIVIGIPRGGTIVADVLARKLDAEFDVVIPRKLRAPHNTEQAIGAVMQDGSLYIDDSMVESEKISKEYIIAEIQREKNEIDRRMKLYRPNLRDYLIKNRTVILVDDGAATGSTLIVAARWIRKQLPKRLIIAVPVAPKSIMRHLQNEADIVEVLKKPSNFKSVEYFYQNFRSVPDSVVLKILKNHGLL